MIIYKVIGMSYLWRNWSCKILQLQGSLLCQEQGRSTPMIYKNFGYRGKFEQYLQGC